MKIVILAGGKSERLKPFYEKPLLKFCGKTLIRHQLEIIFEAGGRDFLIIGSENNMAALKTEIDIFRDEFAGGIKVDLASQTINEGSAGALKSVEVSRFYSQEGTDRGILLVSSNDILELTAYTGLMNTAEQNPGCSVILGQKVEKYFPGGYLLINKKNELEKIIEKPGEGNEPSNLINIVAHFHPSAQVMMNYVNQAASEKDDLYEKALDDMIAAGLKIKVAHYSGKWQAIKFPWHIYDAAQMLFEKELRWRGKKSTTVGKDTLIAEDLVKADSAVIKGNVIIESGVKILENAVISGPAYIGKGSLIANNALVRESYLGENCVAGFTTEICRSYLGDQVWTHSNYLGDSIIGNNVSFGAGTITGNLRLDEKEISVMIKNQKVPTGKQKIGVLCGDNVRIGINNSLMPGIKIGAGTMIGGGAIIGQDIEEKKFVIAGQNTLEIRESNAEIPGDRSKLMEKITSRK